MRTIALKLLMDACRRSGVETFAVQPARPVAEPRRRALELWQEQGFAAELEYMKRSSELFADPRKVFENCQTVVSCTFPYSHEPVPGAMRGYGRVGRYAWGRDYHKVLKKRLEAVCELLNQELGQDLSFRIFSDAVPLLEREIAAGAGLGFQGKNTMLIQPGKGSFFFVAEILLAHPLSGHMRRDFSGSCGSCRRCQDACPTQAFASEGVLDAGRCISYLTIEKRGPFSEWESQALGDWVFGCDICQDVCPFNHSPLKRLEGLPEFRSEEGVGAWLELRDLLSMRSHEDCVQRFAGTALMRAKRPGLLRNALSVARNQGLRELEPDILKVAADDELEELRASAILAWLGLSEIGGGSFQRKKLSELLESETSSLVRAVIEEGIESRS